MSALAVETLRRQELARAFADALSYPHAVPAEAAHALAAALEGEPDEAVGLVRAFAAFVEEADLGPLQEAYTRTFDLDTMSRSMPTCYPYVGHWLFEETHKRGAFILELRRRFRAAGFSDEGELGDHLVVLLRFLAVCEDDVLAGELISDAILPALTRMAVAAEGDGRRPEPGRDAYLGILGSLHVVLSERWTEGTLDPAEQELEREWLRDRDSLGISRDGCKH